MPTFSMKLTTILADQSALLALKDQVIHDPENVLTTNLSASVPVCSWFGVSCGSKHRRVTALNLTGLGLVGTLPPHLGNLSFLSLFYVTHNSFYGGLPVQFSNLRRLKYLSFGNNSFSGEIPSWLGSLTELRRLFLYQNNFKGVIPFSLGYLSKLQTLNLTQPDLGSIPSSIFNISSLQNIYLGDNMLSGSIPSVPRDLLSLEVIDFTFNNLGSIPSVPRDLLSLEVIDFTFNNLGGHIPKDMFDHLPNLKELHLSVNLLSGRIPASLFKCKELQMIISLGGNQLSGHLPSNMGLFLPNMEILYLDFNQLLTRLDMSTNYFSGSIPDNLGNLRNLKFLNLENNNLTSSGMSFLFSLTNFRVLKKLLFGTNPFISGEFPRVVGNLSRGNKIPTTIGGLKELQSLSLDDDKLEGSIPSELCHLNKLAFFDLISLRQLGLDSNMFSSSIPSTLTRLNYLLILYLSSNSLSGPLPIDIGKGKVLTSLDLSNNQFSGPHDFSLSNNRIMGSIPGSFDELLSLEFLDLSRNNLSGKIPKSLEKLRYLKYFNVSFNRLEGEIPEGGSFGNYTIESLKGNEALCALPIASTILVVALIIILQYRRKDKLRTQEDRIPLGTWRRFSYHELRQATDGFNDIFQGTLQDGTVIAVKVFKLELEGAFKSFDVECDVSATLSDKWLYSNNQYLDIVQRLNIMIDVASALEYLHHGNATPVVHYEDMVAHLSFNDTTMTMATFEYMAPGIVSTKGDVYSFGILLMEIITRKKPTDEMFEGERSLKSWVIESISSSLNQVVDPKLLSTIGREHLKVKNCALSILQLSLECCVELPNERLHMKEIVTKLKKIKVKLLRDMERVR
ncbi:hypothetical protein V6Z11_1Z003900 [Gossypium hirsutum]